MDNTDEILLNRIKAGNAHDAWRDFYRLYWASIVRYSLKLGLNNAQAQDVLQETMITLMRILPQFCYDRDKGQFRNFLLTIVHRKALAVVRRLQRRSEIEFNSNVHDSVDPFDVEQVDRVTVDRWRETLIEEALARLRNDAALDDRTIDIFFAYAVARLPVKDVAEKFGVKENAVYQIKNRLMRRLQSEVRLLTRNC